MCAGYWMLERTKSRKRCSALGCDKSTAFTSGIQPLHSSLQLKCTFFYFKTDFYFARKLNSEILSN